jgi:hypothetical protein
MLIKTDERRYNPNDVTDWDSSVDPGSLFDGLDQLASRMTTVEATGTGDVVGPSSATDNAIARYDSTTGKLLQDSLITIDDTGSLGIPSAEGMLWNHTKTVELISTQGSQTGCSFRLVGTTSGNHDITINDSTQTLTNKTLTTPTITDLSNATHDHSNAAGGGTLAINNLSDVSTSGVDKNRFMHWDSSASSLIISGSSALEADGSQFLTSPWSVGDELRNVDGLTIGQNVAPDTDFFAVNFWNAQDTHAILACSCHNNVNNRQSHLYLTKSGGTRASKTAVVDTENVGQILWLAHDGTSYKNVFQIRTRIGGTVSTGVTPGDVAFRIMGSTGTFATAMTFEADGYVSVGVDITPLARLHLEGGTTEGQELLLINQLDADQPFIKYDGTSAANTSNNITTFTTGNSIQGFIRVDVEGTDRWMPFYDAPTS